jgi:hypothetical protein
MSVSLVFTLQTLIEGIEAPASSVLLDLPVPSIGGKLLKPGSKFRQLLLCQTTNGGLKFLNAHTAESLRTCSFSCKNCGPTSVPLTD